MKNVFAVIVLYIFFLPSWFLLANIFEARESIHGEWVAAGPNIGRAIGSFIAACLSVYLTSKMFKEVNKTVLFFALTTLAILIGGLSLTGWLLYPSDLDTTYLLLLIGLDILVIGAIIFGAYVASKD
ncbi:MAG: hypothetical protein AB1422_12585 [bacterium]